MVEEKVRPQGVNLVDAHFPEAFFDYVHVNNVLEHVLDPMAFLKEVKRIVKPRLTRYCSRS